MRIKEQNSNQMILVHTIRERLRITVLFFTILTVVGLLLVTNVGIIWIALPIIVAFAFAGWITGDTVTIDTATSTITILGREFFLRHSRRQIPLSAVQHVALEKEHGALSGHDNIDELWRNLEIVKYWGNYRNLQDRWLVYLRLSKENLLIDKSTDQSAMYRKASHIADFMGKELVGKTDTNDA